MDQLARWPLLLAAAVLLATGTAVDLATEAGTALAAGLVVMGATAVGAFLYAEGARHREWWTRRGDDDEPDGPTL